MNNVFKPTTKYGRTSFEVSVAATRTEVFEACRDVRHWKRFMPAVLAAEFVNPADPDGYEVIRVTARANEDTHSWESARYVSPDRDLIRFSRLSPVAPLLKMEGVWRFTDAAEGTLVRLEHSFATETPASRIFFLNACRANARTDLDGLCRLFGPGKHNA